MLNLENILTFFNSWIYITEKMFVQLCLTTELGKA